MGPADKTEQRLRDLLITPVITIENTETAVPVAKALASGGLPVIEIAFRSPVAASALSEITEKCPEILAGAGTIMNQTQAASALEAGCTFIVSPGLDPGCASFCEQNHLLYIPGCYTATEIQSAFNMGLRLVKFFPAENGGGVAMLSALASAFPDVSFLPTGGLKPDNFGAYLACPFVACVGCSWVAPKNLINEKNYAAITERAKAAVTCAKRNNVAGA